MLKFAKWAAGLLALLSSYAATAQTYPTRPVRIIVPYQAGQGTDVVARYFAEHLSRSLGQRFYIENKAGAGGNIGTEQAAHAEAELGISFGQTTGDRRTTLEPIYCLGLCAVAPSGMLDGRVYGRLDKARVDQLIAEARR